MSGYSLQQTASRLLQSAMAKTGGAGLSASLISDYSHNTSSFRNPQPTERSLTAIVEFAFTSDDRTKEVDQRVRRMRGAVAGAGTVLKVGNRIKVFFANVAGHEEYEVTAVKYINPQGILIVQKLELMQVNAVG